MDLSRFLEPALSPTLQALFRSGYGALLTLTLLQLLPQGPRFLTTATHGGYLDPSPLRDALLRQGTWPLVFAAWLAAALALTAGVFTVPAALLNFGLCYWFFIHTRWSGILRGMGAPGFMSWWLGAAVLMLETATHYDPSGRLRPWVVLAFRVDFALIMLCAGLYKANAGYRSGDGMELGMVNPWWGYWWRWFSTWRGDHPMFRLFNLLAWLVQIGSALLMLFPPTREIGGMAIAISFAGIALQIRLGWLCEKVILATLLMHPAGGLLDRLLAQALPAPAPVTPVAVPWLAEALLAGTIAYLVLLPLSKLGQYANFYFQRRLPGPLQWALERWTNLWGIIIWRVFTVDVTCFHVDIEVRDPARGETRVYARPGRLDWFSRFRYLHVGEFICLASIFTTLKYHASNRALFEEKLVRYARTIPCQSGQMVRFLYRAIRKQDGRFEHVPVAELTVDPVRGSVEQVALDTSFSLNAAGSASPVHEGARPGTYAPAR